jgi:hypothetical protein
VVTTWGWMAAGYGACMAAIAVAGGTRRRATPVVAALFFAGASAAASTVHAFAAQVWVPGAVALAGYWLSGLFIGPPQPWLEARLLDSDRRLFEWLRLNQRLRTAPSWLLESLEFCYSTVYLVVMAGAVAVAVVDRQAVGSYWAIVLPAEFICYLALPFLRSRPPRSLEPVGVIASRAPRMRRLNDAIVGGGSIQVNTIPSGHVAGALAAGLAVLPWSASVGAILIVIALLIGVAATVGRYHYAIDCLLGAGVAMAVWVIAALR